MYDLASDLKELGDCVLSGPVTPDNIAAATELIDCMAVAFGWETLLNSLADTLCKPSGLGQSSENQQKEESIYQIADNERAELLRELVSKFKSIATKKSAALNELYANWV